MNEKFFTDARNGHVASAEIIPLDVFGSAQIIGSPRFPLGLVPEVIERRALDVALRLGVDPAMVALPMLGVCAAAIDDRIRLYPLAHDSSWSERACLWIAVIADSGQKKTPALNAALAPVREVEKAWMVHDAERLHEYQAQLALHTEADKLQRRLRAKALATGTETTLPELPPLPNKPPMRRKEVKDITVEALSQVLAENAWGILAVYDELTAWFSSFDAYRSGSIKRDRALYLEAYNGGPQLIDRVTRGRVFVPNWSLSLVGGIQPEAMRKLAGTLTDDGLAQRFLVVFTESDGLTTDAPEDAEAKAWYHGLVSRLMQWDIGGPETRLFCTFAPEAHAVRDALNQQVHAVRQMPWVTPAFHAHLAKWEGLFPRLCLLFHVVEQHRTFPFPESIPFHIAERVSAFLLDYLLPHAARFYTDLLQTHAEAHHARWIAGYILAHDLTSLSVRDIGRAYRSLRGDVKEIALTMSYLSAIGWVTPLDVSPGKPPSRWTVTPAVHLRFHERKHYEQTTRAETIRKIQAAVLRFPALDGTSEDES
jgi:Protein of unknown function (DUF3987)